MRIPRSFRIVWRLVDIALVNGGALLPAALSPGYLGICSFRSFHWSRGGAICLRLPRLPVLKDYAGYQQYQHDHNKYHDI